MISITTATISTITITTSAIVTISTIITISTTTITISTISTTIITIITISTTTITIITISTTIITISITTITIITISITTITIIFISIVTSILQGGRVTCPGSHTNQWQWGGLSTGHVTTEFTLWTPLPHHLSHAYYLVEAAKVDLLLISSYCKVWIFNRKTLHAKINKENTSVIGLWSRIFHFNENFKI